MPAGIGDNLLGVLKVMIYKVGLYFALFVLCFVFIR